MGCTDSKPADRPANAPGNAPKLNANPAVSAAAKPPVSKPPAAKLAAPPAEKLPPPVLGESGELDVSGSNYDKSKGRQRKVVKKLNPTGGLDEPE